MASITLKGNNISTSGDLPKVGEKAPPFMLTNHDLEDVSLEDFKGKKVLLNIFPSVDTPVCATSIKKFNLSASEKEAAILCVSRDLPFAFKRFCAAEGIESVHTLAEFRTNDFGSKYGVEMTDGPLRKLFARAVVVIDEEGTIVHSELVPEIADEPNYAAALEALS